MKKLSNKAQLLVGVALFSMFFGAGNLIFPPFLGLTAGTNTLPAFLGLALSAIGLPILGVIAVARTGGLQNLAGRAGKPFAVIFTMIIYLSIGPFLAIPRNCGTSFEMALPLFADEATGTMQLIYSLLFFSLALFLALRPTRLVDVLGKRTAPTLLLLIATLSVAALVKGLSSPGTPGGIYVHAPAANGFVYGYQTMDALAALIFGIILTVNIQSRGISEKADILSVTKKAGVIAALLFIIVYGALTALGAYSGTTQAANGAQVLTDVAGRLFGSIGQAIVAAIFFIACLNTCISLICCCAEYFHRLMPRVSYSVWASVFAAVSALLANAGLSTILKFSVPALGMVYPIAILLIALAFLPQDFHKNRPLLYPLSIALTACVSIVSSLKGAGLTLPVITDFFASLPLAAEGLAWLLPAGIGLLIGVFVKEK